MGTNAVAIRPLWDGFGALIEGVDLSADLSDATLRALCMALHEHQVIKFPAQSLTREAFMAYGEELGEPIPHVLDHRREPGLPGMMTLARDSNSDGESFNGAAYWHTDQSYEKVPSSATTLHARAVPKESGGTRFANMFAAYDDLPDAMKRRLDGLMALHLYGNRDAHKPGEWNSVLKTDAQRAHVPMCEHSIVRPHPITGRKALYAVSGTSRGIVGMPEDEALDLLGQLKEHALQPKYTVTHHYEVGDVITWDTSSTLHASEPLVTEYSEAHHRIMWRISVRGRPRVLRQTAS